MCGIVGVTGNKKAVNILLNGLKKLEYRGYDSAGIYVNDQNGKDSLIKRKGNISHLINAVGPEIKGSTGIGHTRWATNGAVSVENAHPQFSQDNRFYLVHNGVIDNYKELKKQYLSDVKFTSQTDTEVVVQLVDKLVTTENISTKQAFFKTLKLLNNSSYSFLLMDREQPDTLFVAKNKSPLLVGVGNKNVGNVVCSDSLAMLNITHDFIALKDGEIVTVKPDSIEIQNLSGQKVERKPFHVDMDASATDKGPYPYYMLKEINEQPNIMHKLSQEYMTVDGKPKIDSKILSAMKDADRLYIVGAGTSYHAGLVGKALFEKLVHIPTEAHISSEFAYSDTLLSDHPFFIFLSQSGETADSRVVLNDINKKYDSLTITNVKNSTLSREATYTMLLNAGPEISVASTKAYTAQIAVEAILAKALGEKMGQSTAKNFDVKRELSLAANGMQAVIDDQDRIDELSKKYFVHTNRAFYIGRGEDYYVSLENALKLKEISYIQAEGFASGELKHGTIALIEKGTPVIALITQKRTANLTRSNLEETESRGSKGITIVRNSLAHKDDDFVIPDVNELLTPLVSVVPAQLLAYYTTLNKGYNVDHPRNLAKSVTVE